MVAPTVYVAHKRRWWLLVTSLVENVLFSAVLLGWSALLMMLKAERFYHYLCQPGNGTESNASQAQDLPNTDAVPQGCSEQDSMLNLCFTVGSFLLSALTFPIGMVMDKVGCRMLRMVGAGLHGMSYLLLSLTTPGASNLLFLAIPFNGIGGITVVFTSFQVTNMFGHLRSTMISLMIGTYATSAVVFTTMKALYDHGVPFQAMCLAMVTGCVLVILNTYWNVPEEQIPAPDKLKFSVHTDALKLDHRVTGEKFYSHISNVGMRMASSEVMKYEDMYTSNIDLCVAPDPEEKEEKRRESRRVPLHRVILTPIFLWSVLVMCITQLRLLFFIGGLQQMLLPLSGGDMNTVATYCSIFGILQLCCLLTAPLIGFMMDYKTKEKKLDEILLDVELDSTSERSGSSFSSLRSTESQRSKKMDMKIRKLRNGMNSFLVTDTLTIVFGVMVLIPNLHVQIVSFICHTLIRGFVHSAVGGLYAVAYHFMYYGSLVGLQSLISAVFTLIQYPIFLLIQGPLHHDPFWINVALLILSLLNYSLPLYLWRYTNKLNERQRRRANIASAVKITSPSIPKLVTYPRMTEISLLPTVLSSSLFLSEQSVTAKEEQQAGVCDTLLERVKFSLDNTEREDEEERMGGVLVIDETHSSTV